ncbi:histamine H1 receptor-like [Amphibalanus amphitrite]|uniref:histamine H1 receptor-like n=1 Tax=Amphibalanus amphitrite TaxID=1232801 RepID=UPI001C91A638|nr:histamine H1 receptor-like [Amphibalanus amphitrite]
MFIMSLAAADLIVGVFVMPLGSLYAIKGEWVLGLTMCRIWLIVDYIASTASILNLCILSLDRYWSITAPLKYLRRRTKRRALAMISSVWLLSSSWIWPVVFFDWLVSPPLPDAGTSLCETGFAQNLVFKVVAAIFNFYIPWVSMMYLYVRMFAVIRQRSKLEVGRFHLANRTASNGAEPADKQRVERRTSGSRRAPLDGSVSYDNLILMALPDLGGMAQYVGRYDGLHVQIELAEDADGESDQASLGGTPAPRRHRSRSRRAGRGAVVLQNAAARAASCAQRRTSPTGGGSPQLNGSKSQPPPAGGGNIILQREKKAAVQLGVIMGAFILCWLPYSILFVAVAVCPDCVDENVHMGSIWLGYLNSTLNPVLYPLCNANFKRAFKRMLGFSPSRESRRNQSSSQAPRMHSQR